jgi:hypothetical protein
MCRIAARFFREMRGSTGERGKAAPLVAIACFRVSALTQVQHHAMDRLWQEASARAVRT